MFSAIGSVVGGVIQSAWNNKMQREAQDFQRSERIAGQEYQTSEREAMQQYQTGEREAQNQYSEDMYNKYSSPEARVRQLKAAGLNPILASDNAGVGSVAASSGSSGGAPGSGGAVQGHAPTPPYQGVGVWSDIMGNAANAIKTLAEAKKVGLDVKWYEDLVKSKLRTNELQQAFQELVNSVESWRMPKKAQAELDLFYKTLQKEDATIDEIKAHTEKLVHDGRISKQTADTFMEAFKNTQDNLKSQTAVNNADVGLKEAQTVTEQGKPALQKSEISRNFASAKLAIEESKISHLKGDSYKAVARYNDALSEMQEMKNEVQSINQPFNILNSLHASQKFIERFDYETRILFAEVRKAEAEGDFAKVNQILNAVSSVIGSVSGGALNVFTAYRNFKAGKHILSGMKGVKSNEPISFTNPPSFPLDSPSDYFY